MKKILLAVTAALAITSCSQNEEFENEGQKTEINFTTIVSKATRASELKTEGLKTNGGFKVFAYNTKDNDMSAETILGETPFMDGVVVSWNSSAWTMNPVGPYYWPLKDKIQFFSYSPVAHVNYVEPTSSKAGYPSFSYTIVDSQEDLVVAYAKNETKPGVSGTPVKLDFKHVLTQINFKLKGKDDGFTYKVTEITLSGINNAGNFTYVDPTESVVGTWSNPSTSTSYQYNATYTDFTGTSELTLATGDNALMLMPQTLGENAEITIAYSTVYGGGEVFNGEKKVSLKDVVWGAGDKILYTLLLPGGAENVTFTPDVTNWNTQTTPEANEAQ